MSVDHSLLGLTALEAKAPPTGGCLDDTVPRLHVGTSVGESVHIQGHVRGLIHH